MTRRLARVLRAVAAPLIAAWDAADTRIASALNPGWDNDDE